MPKLFTNVFGYTSTISAWIRPNKETSVLTVMRTVKDVEADDTRRYVCTYVCISVHLYACGVVKAKILL